VNEQTESSIQPIIERRVPLPVIYEDACRALVKCSTIEEAKYFADKAEALEAWSKIYKSDEAFSAARRLKLHAFRRIGDISSELRPNAIVKVHLSKGRILHRRTPGPLSLLMEKGFSDSVAKTIRRVSSIEKNKFDAALAMDKPPTPTMLVTARKRGASEPYLRFVGGRLISAIYFCRKNPVADFIGGLSDSEIAQVRRSTVEIFEWLDEFELRAARRLHQ
jgi:hypothetical protein